MDGPTLCTVHKRWVYAAASGEVCAHQTGHALLDALRPRYFGCFAPEVTAYHEAVGDGRMVLEKVRKT